MSDIDAALADLNTTRNRVIFANARRICKREYQRSANWVLVSELFGLGSTYSFGLCRLFGVDPYCRVSDRRPTTTQGE